MADSAVTITGNLTRDPEVRFTASGIGVASLSVAVNHRVRKGDDWEDEVSFVDVTAWDPIASNLTGVAKGMRVTVTGRLKQENWVDKDGGARSKLGVVADEVSVSLRFGQIDGFTKASPGGSPRPAPASAPTHDPNQEPFWG